MKKYLSLLIMSTMPFLFSNGQILKRIGEKVKAKTEEKIEKTTDKKTDLPANENQAEEPATPGTGKDESKSQTAPAPGKNNRTAYKSKFDFVPGENVLIWEDFATDAVGDFPAKWFTDGSGEVVTLEGYEGKWLMMKGSSQYFIDELQKLPDNFTIQFDLMCAIPFNWGSGNINFEIKEVADNGDKISESDLKKMFRMTMHPGLDNPGGYNTNSRGSYDMARQHANMELKEMWMPTAEKNLLHVSIWRQKERLRVYINENKVLDLPKILPADMKPNLFVWRTEGFYDEDHYFASNLRIAIGNPDTRNKLLTEGKWVTSGILFNVNSDVVKPESYGVLKEIAGILNEDKTVQVKIIGHTDSDGDDAKNLDLSKRRAASVKNALAADFNIAAERMETDGLGETKPIVPNTNPINKANNRRVEFIKIN